MLIKAFISHKTAINLSFVKENGRWYADIKGWPQKYHDNAEMVFGANRFLEHLSKGKSRVTLNIQCLNDLNVNYSSDVKAVLTQKASSLLNGAVYDVYTPGFSEDIWICPVTLFVLGYYPKRILVKVID